MTRILVEPNAYHLMNMGDVAMLEVAVGRLHRLFPDATIEVITDSPERLARYVPAAQPVRARGRAIWFRDHYIPLIHRVLPGPASRRVKAFEQELRRRWPHAVALAILARSSPELKRQLRAFLRSVYDADIVVVSGAGALTDAFAPLAMSVLDLLEMAKRNGSVTAFVGQGVGPVSDEILKQRARQILPTVDLITLREGLMGLQLIESLGVPPGRVLVTGDDALELAAAHLMERRSPPRIGFNMRAARYSGVDADDIALVGDAVRSAAARLGAELKALPISYVPKEDDARVIASALGTEIDDVSYPRRVQDAVAAAAQCRIVVTGSYHAAVFALAQGVPAIGLARSRYYRQKFLGLRDQFGELMEVILLDDSEAATKLVKAIDGAWSSADDLAEPLHQAALRQIELSEAAYARLGQLCSLTSRKLRKSPVATILRPPSRQSVSPFNLHGQESRSWEERAEAAARMLGDLLRSSPVDSGDRLRIADLGCGNERLEGPLAREIDIPFSYQGYDLLPQQPGIVAIDLERELPTVSYDFVFALGLLEYLDDLPWFLKRLQSRFPTAIVSYSIADSPVPLTRRQRRSRGWRSHYTKTECEIEFERAGWLVKNQCTVARGRTGLWLLASLPT